MEFSRVLRTPVTRLRREGHHAMKALGTNLIVVLLLWLRIPAASLACPQNCDCIDSQNGPMVSCTGKGFTKLVNPNDLPRETYQLDMSRNEIEHLGSLAFVGERLSKVKKLIFSHNKIKAISEDAFSGLKKLTKIDLSHNKLSFLQEGVFKGLKNLKNLDLSRNQLMMFNGSQFYGSKNLRTINLSNNKLTVLPDRLFDSLGNLQSLNLQLNPLICDCNLKWMIKWMANFKPKPNNKRLTVLGRCEHPLKVKENKLSALDKKEMVCDKLNLPVLDLSPQGSQVAFNGDSHVFKCRSSWIPDALIGWYKDGKRVTAEINDRRWELIQKFEIELLVLTTEFRITPIRATDSGYYTCNVTYKGGYAPHIRQSHLSVISHNSQYCKTETTETDRGTFNWDRTAAGGFASLPCPVGVIGRLFGSQGSEEVTARRKCSLDGEWMKVEAKSCAYANKITQTLHSLKEATVNETTVVAVSEQLLNISRQAKEFGDSLDVIFAADVVYNLRHVIGSDVQLNANLVHTISNLSEADEKLLRVAQQRAKSCSSMIIALDFLSTRFQMIRFTEVSIVSSNIAVQVVRISVKDLVGKTCVVTTEMNRKLKEMECVPWSNETTFERRAQFDTSIHLPPSLFQQIQRKQTFQLLNFQFIAYFNSKLFPEISNGSTEKSNTQVSSSVVSAQLGGIQLTNLSDPVVIKFRNHQSGKQPFPVYWDVEGGGGLGKWMKNDDCNISTQDNNTITECHQLAKKDFFAVMMFVEGSGGSPIKRSSSEPFSLEPIVFIGAGICSLLIVITLVTYIVFRELRFNRDDAAMLMNECLALLVVVVVFVAGISHVSNVLVCRAVGVLLHYFLLCSLLWIGCGGICLCRLIRTSIQPEEFNPVLRYYMISWGIPLIICGITIAGNPDNYNVHEYCWLRPHPFYGAFVGPACLISIIDLVIFIRLHNMIKRTYNVETLEVSDAVETATEENALVIQQERSSNQEPSNDAEEKPALPDKDDLIGHLRGSCCILLVLIVSVVVGILTVHFQEPRALYVSLSCVFAVAIVFLGIFIFIFHCYKKDKVRVFWSKSFKCRCLPKKRYELQEENEGVENSDEPSTSKNVANTANGEAGKFDGIHGARHANSDSNVSLPSSAVITIGRPVSAVVNETEALIEKSSSVSDKHSCVSAPLPLKYSSHTKLRQHPPGYRHSYADPTELPLIEGGVIVDPRKAPIAPPEATASSMESSVQLPTDTESNAAPSEGRLSARDTVELLNASRNTNTSCSASEKSCPIDVVPPMKWRPPIPGSSSQGPDRVPVVPHKKIRNSATMPGGRDYQTVHRPETIPEFFAHHSVAEATTNSLPRQIPRDHVVVREQYHIPYEPRALSEKPRDHYQILPLPSERTREHYMVQPVHYPAERQQHEQYQDPRGQNHAPPSPLEQNYGPLDQCPIPRDQRQHEQCPIPRDPSPSPRPQDQYHVPRDLSPAPRPHDQYPMPRDQRGARDHYQVPRDLSPGQRMHEHSYIPREQMHGPRPHDQYQVPRESHATTRTYEQIPRDQTVFQRPHEQNTITENPRDENDTSVEPSQTSRDPKARSESAGGPTQEPVEQRPHDQYAGDGPPAVPLDKNGVRPHGAARSSRDQPGAVHVPRRRSRNPYQIARDIHLGLNKSRDVQSRHVKQAPAEPRSQSKSPARETTATSTTTVRTLGETPRERTPRSSMSSWKEERPKPEHKDWVAEPPKCAVFVPVPHIKQNTPQSRSETSV